MQIEILSPTNGQPLPPVQWNYTQLKEQLTASLAKYKGRVYTDADITAAKKDRAALNKLAAAIDGKRKEMKALYLAPYQEFETQAKELAGMVSEQSDAINAQVKAYEEQRKSDKLEKIDAYYLDAAGELAQIVPYSRLHSPKWLNVTVSMSSIEKELDGEISRITSDFETINSIESEYLTQIKDKYLKTLDLGDALREKARLEEQAQKIAAYEAKETREKPSAPEPVQVQPETAQQLLTVDFRVWATAEQLPGLKEYMKTHGIKYGRV